MCPQFGAPPVAVKLAPAGAQVGGYGVAPRDNPSPGRSKGEASAAPGATALVSRSASMAIT